MGLFRVRGRLTGPTGRSEDADLLVDTGATFLVVPRALAERLEVAAHRFEPVVIAGGQQPAPGRGPRREAADPHRRVRLRASVIVQDVEPTAV